MEYVIIGAFIFWAFYYYKQKKNDSPILVSVDFYNREMEEIKKQRLESLAALKKSFQSASNNDLALAQASETLVSFHNNHDQSPKDISSLVKDLGLPDDLIQREVALRKEINKYYKKRSDYKSKSMAIQLAFEHVKLQLQNPDNEWKNFDGLQKLQSNWKSEEYFNGILILMIAYKNTFAASSNYKKLTSDIERMFKLWNSQNIAFQTYQDQLKSYEAAQSYSDKHFIILSIINYLERRYKFNPKHKGELIKWCLKDVELYENFLKEFHEHKLFSLDQTMEFYNNPALKKKKINAINFEQVKNLKDYMVPRLNSYDVLARIYTDDENEERMRWLQGIGYHIGYINDTSITPVKKESFDYKTITREIEVYKSGQNGKLGFLNSKKDPCSAEEAFKDYTEQEGWCVMRAEVSFWQAMFCLSFWDEIFEGMGSPYKGRDIPRDLFQGKIFYLSRKQAIDRRYKQIKKHSSLFAFINEQIESAEGTWTRLLYNGNQDMLAYSKSSIVQEFIGRISHEIFAKIVYRIAQNPSENRSGVPDFVIWNDQECIMLEIKKLREQIKESQKLWLSWMVNENIPVEIVRIKGV